MHRCSTCGQPWDDARARDNELTCTRRCGGRLVPVAPPALPDLDGCDFTRLPYPVALTAHRLAAALRTSGDVLKTLFLLKDCFEATIKYLGAVMLADYRLGPACTPEHNASLLEKVIRPSLGVWVETVVGSLSRWLVGGSAPGGLAAGLFMTPGKKPRGTELFAQCRAFVEYRNGALGHGALRADPVYDADLRAWLPRLRGLLDGAAGLAGWRLCLPTDRDRCRVWMGPLPGEATEPGDFSREQVDHFLLRGPGGQVRDLDPFLCHLPDPRQERRLHFYDSLCRYGAARKEVEALEYDHGFRQASAEPVAGLEEAFTAQLLAEAFGRHRGRMAVIEGRVANFGELIEAHAAIVGRRFAVDRVRRFLAEHDRGLLVVEAQPGKGKTALTAHLIEEVFGHYAPRPVHFFYRRTAGITDPDVCARSLYQALLDAHGITEAEESKQKNSPEEVFIKLTNLLAREIAPRLLPGRPQLIFIDALDEAGAGAFRRVPENLPAGVYVIATTRPVADRADLARREHLHWYDLDAPDLVQENLRDGSEYVRRELARTGLSDQALGEVARVGAGNFLVLKLLCQHLRTALPPGQVADFLRRLATDGGEDRLGFIYAEFWRRLTERCSRQDENLLCDVAGALVTARAPLPADMACGVLSLRAGDWDFALRHLAEYLTAVAGGADGGGVTYYRVYHESFADFLRQKVAPDRRRLGRLLGDYCLRWAELPEGYARAYALRFGPRHLLDEGRGEEAADLLLDLPFLEAKAEAGMVFELAGDFPAAAAVLSEEDHRRRWLELIDEALRRDIHFVARHPTALFQCLWNSAWWYDCPAAARYYRTPAREGLASPPWRRRGPKLYKLLEGWLERKRARPGFVWLRSLRPPPDVLGGALRALLLNHDGPVTSVTYSPDGRKLLTGSNDGTVRVWDVGSGAELLCLGGHQGIVTTVAYSRDGGRLASGGEDGKVLVRDALAGGQLLRLSGHVDSVRKVGFSPDGRRIVTAGDDATVRVWDAAAGSELLRLLGHEKVVEDVCYDPDGRHLVSGSRDNTLRVWDVTGGRELRRIRVGMTTPLPGTEGGGRGAEVLIRLFDDIGLLSLKGMALSPDGRRVVTLIAMEGGVWDAADGRFLLRLSGAGFVPGSCAAFSADGGRIVTSAADNTLVLWDARTGKRLATFPGHQDHVFGVAFSPDGAAFVSTAEDGTIRVWRAAPGARPLSLHGAQGYICCLAFSPDGERLAVGLDGLARRNVQLWDAAGTAPLGLEGHDAAVVDVWFTPDGRRLVTEAGDATARVWDVRSGTCLEVVPGGKGALPVAEPAGAGRWEAEEGFKEVVIKSRDGGRPIAWFSRPVGRLVAHPSGRAWAGSAGRHLYLLALEGDPAGAVAAGAPARRRAGRPRRPGRGG